MKTLTEMKRDYSNLLEEAKNLDSIEEKRKLTLIKKRLKLINKAIFYIECLPYSEYCHGELNALKEKYKRLYGSNPYLATKKPEESKKSKKYEAEHELPKIREQIKFLKYILN